MLPLLLNNLPRGATTTASVTTSLVASDIVEHTAAQCSVSTRADLLVLIADEWQSKQVPHLLTACPSACELALGDASSDLAGPGVSYYVP